MTFLPIKNIPPLPTAQKAAQSSSSSQSIYDTKRKAKDAEQFNHAIFDISAYAKKWLPVLNENAALLDKKGRDFLKKSKDNSSFVSTHFKELQALVDRLQKNKTYQARKLIPQLELLHREIRETFLNRYNSDYTYERRVKWDYITSSARHDANTKNIGLSFAKWQARCAISIRRVCN
jgi:hypothetical protein